MAAPKGNNYWQFRNKHGRNYEYTPEALWNEFIEYAKWIESNPLKEAVIIQRGIKDEKTQKTSYTTDVNKMRAMTIKSFCLFADIIPNTFYEYQKREDFKDITTRIRNSIFSQKLEGSAAGLLQPMIIARELGLIDKQQIEDINTDKTININYNGKKIDLSGK